MAVRGLSLASRFVLILAVAKALGPADFGVFTLIQTTAIVAVLVLGFELNAFTRREIVTAQEPALRTRFIRDQFAVSFLLGLAAFPLAYVSVLAGLFPLDVAWLVAAMILLELLGQEGTRILYALHRVTAGNLTWFVRSSVWVFLVLALLGLRPEALTLFNIMSIWVAFDVLALLLLAYYLRELEWRDVWKMPADWDWLRRGFRVAMPFFITAVFVSVLSYLPRYILFYTRGAYETGIFGLYTGIASGIVNLISTTSIASGMTKAVAAHSQGGETGLQAELKRLWLQCILLMLALSATLLVVFPFVLPFLGAEGYPLDWILLLLVEAAYCAQVASLAAQTGLYARHQDFAILRYTVIAGVLAVPLQFLGAYLAGMHGLAAAMAFSMLLLMALFLAADKKAKARAD